MIIPCTEFAYDLSLALNLAYVLHRRVAPMSFQNEVQKLKQQAADGVAVAENLYIEKQNLRKELSSYVTQTAQQQQQLVKVCSVLTSTHQARGSVQSHPNVAATAYKILRPFLFKSLPERPAANFFALLMSSSAARNILYIGLRRRLAKNYLTGI